MRLPELLTAGFLDAGQQALRVLALLDAVIAAQNQNKRIS
jgi:hypothetical protein